MSEQMKLEYLEPSRLVENPWNPNVVDPINLDKLEQSMTRLGTFKPVIVRELPDGTLQILGGAHRAQIARKKGIQVPVLNLGTIDDARAKAITLADNAQYGDIDSERMAALLTDIGIDAADLLSMLPIDEAELTSYFEHDTPDFDDLGNDLDAGEEIDLQIDAKPTRTHTILRFKVPVEDAAAITECLNRIQREQGFDQADSLTNAGDALVWLVTQTSTI